MEIREVYRTKLMWDRDIENKELTELLISHAKDFAKEYDNKIKTTLEKLKQSFIERGYTEDELAGEVIHVINTFTDHYFLEIKVKVYPKSHDVSLTEQITQSRYISYIHPEHMKTLNELGTKIKNGIAPLIRIAELEEENGKLKDKVEYLENELARAEGELEKCRERCGDQTDEDP
ncbi:MAG: hypothetical protein JHC26_07870 [Thermofilum sp.]|uniref:hypothetical protein n=1 Tax=Thermofilum sp. TaxID=1961369 RepID=UPI002583C06A|nr:hypothetical protein [Thermofilum sp.]MCI4408994.1 hypothetical protein [Thermofilum sp.]